MFNKYTKLFLLVLLGFFWVNCSKNIKVEHDSVLNNQVLNKSTPNNVKSTRVIDDSIPELKEIDKYMIYKNLLTQIFYRSYENVFGNFALSDALAYGLETIPLSNLEQIKNNPEIPKSLIANLIETNQKSELLDKEYGVKAPIISDKGNHNLEKFYEKIKRENPDTKAVINFSKIAFNYSSQGLIYVEYYNPEKGLIKVYMVLKFSDKEERVLPGTINDVKVSNFIQVN